MWLVGGEENGAENNLKYFNKKKYMHFKAVLKHTHKHTHFF